MSDKRPTVEDLENLIRASSKPLTALSQILKVWPENERHSLAAALHARCGELFLKEAMEIKKSLEGE